MRQVGTSLVNIIHVQIFLGVLQKEYPTTYCDCVEISFCTHDWISLHQVKLAQS